MDLEFELTRTKFTTLHTTILFNRFCSGNQSIMNQSIMIMKLDGAVMMNLELELTRTPMDFIVESKSIYHEIEWRGHLVI